MWYSSPCSQAPPAHPCAFERRPSRSFCDSTRESRSSPREHSADLKRLPTSPHHTHHSTPNKRKVSLVSATKIPPPEFVSWDQYQHHRCPIMHRATREGCLRRTCYIGLQSPGVPSPRALTVSTSCPSYVRIRLPSRLLAPPGAAFIQIPVSCLQEVALYSSIEKSYYFESLGRNSTYYHLPVRQGSDHPHAR